MPLVYKVETISLNLKPNKPEDNGTSNRPISLSPLAAKMLEVPLLSTLKACFPLADHQHGFRQDQSVITELTLFTYFFDCYEVKFLVTCPLILSFSGF